MVDTDSHIFCNDISSLVSCSGGSRQSTCAHFQVLLEADVLEGLLVGLQTALSLQNLLMVIGGVPNRDIYWYAAGSRTYVDYCNNDNRLLFQ